MSVPELVPVPGGALTLHDARTKTSREVELRTFALARHPVTWAQWTAVHDTQKPEHRPGSTPVDSVSWLDAVTWCNHASRAAGRTPAYTLDAGTVTWEVSANGYRLPTEAEWEFACRAGTTGPHYAALADIAWTSSDGVDAAQPVGMKQPNRFGLFDMLGNVWEWCWDYSDPARYADYRVMHGGGWADKPWSTRASVRRGSMPTTRLDDLGFRVAIGAVGAAGADEAQGWSHRADQKRANITGSVPFGWTPLR